MQVSVCESAWVCVCMCVCTIPRHMLRRSHLSQCSSDHAPHATRYPTRIRCVPLLQFPRPMAYLTHTHTHTHTRARTHTHPHTPHPHTHTHTRAHTHTHAHTHTTHTHTHATYAQRQWNSGHLAGLLAIRRHDTRRAQLARIKSGRVRVIFNGRGPSRAHATRHDTPCSHCASIKPRSCCRSRGCT